MTVESPAYLLLLAGAALAAALAWTGRRRAAEVVAALAGAARGPRFARTARAKRTVRGLLLAAAVALLALAAADLRWGREVVTPVSSDHEVTVLLDLSYSMRAADVTPSRLHAAAAIVAGSAATLDSARIGLTVFRGDTLELLPPTADREALAAVLAQVTEALPPAPTPAQARSAGRAARAQEERPSLALPPPGSDISRALEQVLARLAGRPQPRHTVVLVTDGEATVDNRLGRAVFGAGVRAALEAAGAGADTAVLPVVIGTPQGIGLLRADGRPVLDAAGNPVTTRARAANVASLARAARTTPIEVTAADQVARAVRAVVAVADGRPTPDAAGRAWRPRARMLELILAAVVAALGAELVRSVRWRGSL